MRRIQPLRTALLRIASSVVRRWVAWYFAWCTAWCVNPLLAVPATPTQAAREAAAPATAAELSVVGQRGPLDSLRGAVVCVERRAAEIGAAVLARGGNAIDAAIAVAFALAVTYPEAGNLGGGGFMLVAMADGRTAAIDYRETAPRAADERLFLDASGKLDPLKSAFGHHVVGVPGTVAGLEEAHRRFGTVPWADLIEPARRLAEEGFAVQPALAAGLSEHAAQLSRFPATAAQLLHIDGTGWQEGERLLQPDLANSLRWIAQGGARSFYEGPIASLIAAEMRRAGALLDERDFAAYRPVVREFLRTSYRGFELLLMPPPSSGGVVLAQVLGVLEPFHLRERGGWNGATRHLFAEASRRAFADRAQFLGDPDASELPVSDLLAELLSEKHLSALRATIDPERATPSATLGPPLHEPEDSSTTHFSIVDAAGNAVANTYTLEDRFGSRLIAPGTGFLLNNELHDFNTVAGRTARDGAIGTAPNQVRGGRRPLSSMTPCIVRRDGAVVLVTGSPGGRTIISTVTQIVLDVLEMGSTLEAAVVRPRQHEQWFPELIRHEQTLDDESLAGLRARGHVLELIATGKFGDAHSIARDPSSGCVHAVADTRIDGWAAAPARR